jgi:hypothetical protein
MIDEFGKQYFSCKEFPHVLHGQASYDGKCTVGGMRKIRSGKPHTPPKSSSLFKYNLTIISVNVFVINV